VIVVVFFLFVILALVFVLLIFRVVDFGRLEDGLGKRFAKQIAFAAHPQALDRIVVDLGHRYRVTAGFQDNNIAWLQFHDHLSTLNDAADRLATSHDRPITAGSCGTIELGIVTSLTIRRFCDKELPGRFIE